MDSGLACAIIGMILPLDDLKFQEVVTSPISCISSGRVGLIFHQLNTHLLDRLLFLDLLLGLEDGRGANHGGGYTGSAGPASQEDMNYITMYFTKYALFKLCINFPFDSTMATNGA